MESRTQMARPRPRTYSINPKVCAMATFPYGGTSCQRARAGTPGLWQKRITSVTTRQDGNELRLITVFARIIRTFFAVVSVHLCVIENFTRPRTWKCTIAGTLEAKDMSSRTPSLERIPLQKFCFSWVRFLSDSVFITHSLVVKTELITL